jgi:hypothetical protein
MATGRGRDFATNLQYPLAQERGCAAFGYFQIFL